MLRFWFHVPRELITCKKEKNFTSDNNCTTKNPKVRFPAQKKLTSSWNQKYCVVSKMSTFVCTIRYHPAMASCRRPPSLASWLVDSVLSVASSYSPSPYPSLLTGWTTLYLIFQLNCIGLLLLVSSVVNRQMQNTQQGNLLESTFCFRRVVIITLFCVS